MYGARTAAILASLPLWPRPSSINLRGGGLSARARPLAHQGHGLFLGGCIFQAGGWAHGLSAWRAARVAARPARPACILATGGDTKALRVESRVCFRWGGSPMRPGHALTRLGGTPRPGNPAPQMAQVVRWCDLQRWRACHDDIAPPGRRRVAELAHSFHECYEAVVDQTGMLGPTSFHAKALRSGTDVAAEAGTCGRGGCLFGQWGKNNCGSS